MRRAVLLLRPTPLLRSKHTLAIKPTRVLCIHPQLARLIIAGGVLLFQAFAVAHSQEARKLREEEKESTGGSAGTSTANTNVGNSQKGIMSSSEALRVLGLNSDLEVPLRNEKDRQEAHWRFKRLFAIAKESDNVYLQGKFSAAYRVCVDAEWDAEDNTNTTTSKEDSNSGGASGNKHDTEHPFQMEENTSALPKPDAMQEVTAAIHKYMDVMSLYDVETVIDSKHLDEDLPKILESKLKPDVEGMALSLVQLFEKMRKALNIPSLHPKTLPAKTESDTASFGAAVSMQSVECAPVRETTTVVRSIDEDGNKVINYYTLHACIGRGSYGKVRLGINHETGMRVAIKIIPKKQVKMGRPSYDKILLREIEVMKKVRHRNCVSLLEVINDPSSDSLYLVMEYMPYGPIVHVKEWSLTEKKELQNYEFLKTVARDGKIMGCEPLPQSICTLYFRQLLSGLDYLHSRNVLHHDIKPDNILRGSDDRVCITDFSVSEILVAPPDNGKRNSLTSNLGGGTLLYTAPEVFEASSDDPPNPFLSDVWSLGITLYLMLVGVAPFNGSLYYDVMKEVRDTPLPWNGKDIFGKELDPQWKTVLDGMLEKNPNNRWSLSKLKWFVDNNIKRNSTCRPPKPRNSVERINDRCRNASQEPLLLRFSTKDDQVRLSRKCQKEELKSISIGDSSDDTMRTEEEGNYAFGSFFNW